MCGCLFESTCVCVSMCVYRTCITIHMLRTWKLEIIGSCRLESNLVGFLFISTLLWLMCDFVSSFISQVLVNKTLAEISLCAFNHLLILVYEHLITCLLLNSFKEFVQPCLSRPPKYRNMLRIAWKASCGHWTKPLQEGWWNGILYKYVLIHWPTGFNCDVKQIRIRWEHWESELHVAGEALRKIVHEKRGYRKKKGDVLSVCGRKRWSLKISIYSLSRHYAGQNSLQVSYLHSQNPLMSIIKILWPSAYCTSFQITET